MENIKKLQYQLTFLPYLGKAKMAVIQKIGVKRAKDKDFSGQDLSDIDLSTVDFTDVYISRANLKNTGAHINPQTIKDKNLAYANLEGLNLSGQDFTGCDIEGTNLKGTNAYIDPQVVLKRNLVCTNLEGLDLFDANFSGADISYANLKNTHAYINPNEVIVKILFDSDMSFKGCFFDRSENNRWSSYLGAHIVYDNPKKLLEWYGNKKDVIINVVGLENAVCHILDNADFSNIDLSDVDFSSLSIFGANLEGTNAFINLNEINSTWINYVKKKGNLSGCRVILSNDPKINKKFDLTNAIILDREEVQVRKLVK